MAEREVAIQSEGRRLAGRLFGIDFGANRPSLPGILFIHGYGSSQVGYRPRAEAAAAATGGVCLTFDLGGHGESSGSLELLSSADHRLDALAAYDKLLEVPKVDPDRIGVCGASYGAYLAASLLADRRVNRLLLRAPAPDRDGRLPPSLSGFTGPVLVVESGEDRALRPTVAAYLEACGGRARHRIIDGATHDLTDPRWRQVFIDLIVEWFRDL